MLQLLLLYVGNSYCFVVVLKPEEEGWRLGKENIFYISVCHVISKVSAPTANGSVRVYVLL